MMSWSLSGSRLEKHGKYVRMFSLTRITLQCRHCVRIAVSSHHLMMVIQIKNLIVMPVGNAQVHG